MRDVFNLCYLSDNKKRNICYGKAPVWLDFCSVRLNNKKQSAMLEIDSNIYPFIRINERIAQRNTGHAGEFAADMGISRSSFFEYKDALEIMVEKFGVHILYNPCIPSYVYDHPGKLVISISWEYKPPDLILPNKPSANIPPLFV